MKYGYKVGYPARYISGFFPVKQAGIKLSTGLVGIVIALLPRGFSDRPSSFYPSCYGPFYLRPLLALLVLPRRLGHGEGVLVAVVVVMAALRHRAPSTHVRSPPAPACS